MTNPRVVKVKTLFDPSSDPGISFVGVAKVTDDSQARDCDVNVIVERFMKTGVLPGTDAQALFGDFSQVPTYQEALAVVAHAESQFESLTAKVRKRFDNDPSQFLAFVNDPRNQSEMVELGLAVERPKATSVVDAATPLPAGSPASGGALNASNAVSDSASVPAKGSKAK